MICNMLRSIICLFVALLAIPGRVGNFFFSLYPVYSSLVGSNFAGCL